VLLDPPSVLDGVVDVVDEDLADAGAPLGELTAPVDQPPVVRPDAGEPVLVVLGPCRLREQEKLGKNGGTVLGYTTSATMPSASCCELRISLSQLRSRRWSPRSRKGFLYFPRHASKSSR
jgi:hypothetical protein